MKEGEHIFNETRLSKLALHWRELVRQKRTRDAMEVLEDIVIGSTQMFQRLAQHENFHHTVDLPILVSAAQEKVVRWLLKWNPKKGKLFSWFSKCAKNAFRSEVVKINQFRTRFHVTGDNLEKFFGVDDPELDKAEASKQAVHKLHGLTCHWGDPQEIGCIKFLIECITEEDHDKTAAINGAAYAWGIPRDQVKFFYQWACVALREQFYAQIHVPFTKQDLFRHEYAYTHLVDLLNVVTWDQMKLLIATRGGMRFKVPTIQQMAKLHADYQLTMEIDKSDKDPDSVGEIAQRYKKSPRTAQEIYEETCEKMNPHRVGEYQIYEE